jgi:hypothetical protein
MRDGPVIEEMAVRAIQENDGRSVPRGNARAIDSGEESTPTGVSKKPSTKNPKIVFAFYGSRPAACSDAGEPSELIWISQNFSDRRARADHSDERSVARYCGQ